MTIMILENRHAWPFKIEFWFTTSPNLPWLLRECQADLPVLDMACMAASWQCLGRDLGPPLELPTLTWSYAMLRDATVLHSPHGTHLLSNHFLLRCCCVFHGLNMKKSSFDTQSDVLRGAYRFDARRSVDEPKEGVLLRLQQGPTSGQIRPAESAQSVAS